MLGERLYVNIFTTQLSEQPLEKPTWSFTAVVQVKTSGALENYCPSVAYRRRVTPNKVGPTQTQCAEPVPFESTSDVNQPIDFSADDLLSLHPGDEEQLGSPDETLGGDIQASQGLSDIPTVEFDELGESDSKDMLHKLAEAYDKAFPDQSSATPASNSSSDISTNFRRMTSVLRKLPTLRLAHHRSLGRKPADARLLTGRMLHNRRCLSGG